MKLLLILALLPSIALATTKPEPPKPTPTPTQTQISSASATATADAVSDADATAYGGSGGYAGSTNTVTVSNQRQAPSVSQGGLFIGDCGAGVNGGGSNASGASFLGITWTPKDCKLLMAARAYQSLGMLDAACEMVNAIKAVKARWKELGIDPPKCQVKEPPPITSQSSACGQCAPVSVTAAPSECATKEQLEKAFRTCASK